MAWTEEGRGLTGTDGDWDARPLLSIRHIGGTPRPNTQNFPTTVRTAYAMGAQCSPSASIVVAPLPTADNPRGPGTRRVARQSTKARLVPPTRAGGSA